MDQWAIRQPVKFLREVRFDLIKKTEHYLAMDRTPEAHPLGQVLRDFMHEDHQRDLEMIQALDDALWLITGSDS